MSMTHNQRWWLRYYVRDWMAHHDFYMWLAWKLPKSLRMWVTIKSFADATTGLYAHEAPDDVGYSKLMKGAGFTQR